MSKNNKKLVSIVVPVFNEAENLPKFYSVLTKNLKLITNHNFEILFVNDGSSDDSSEIIKKFAAKDSQVHILEFVRNFGKEIATSAGLEHATGDAVIMIDADLQHPPKLIPEFIEKWDRGVEVVLGIRKSNGYQSWFKRQRSRLFYKLLSSVSEINLISGTTDFQLLDRAVVDEFNRFTEHGRITRGLVSWLGFQTEHEYFTAEKRTRGETSFRFREIVRLATNSFVSLSLFPLKLAGYLGIIISSLSALAGTYIVFDSFVFDDPFNFSFSGTALLAVLIIFLVGILLSCLGLIALYVGAIHKEVSNRPLYVLRKSR